MVLQGILYFLNLIRHTNFNVSQRYQVMTVGRWIPCFVLCANTKDLRRFAIVDRPSICHFICSVITTIYFVSLLVRLAANNCR